jgi:hypothetical protein
MAVRQSVDRGLEQGHFRGEHDATILPRVFFAANSLHPRLRELAAKNTPSARVEVARFRLRKWPRLKPLLTGNPKSGDLAEAEVDDAAGDTSAALGRAAGDAAENTRVAGIAPLAGDRPALRLYVG